MKILKGVTLVTAVVLALAAQGSAAGGHEFGLHRRASLTSPGSQHRASTQERGTVTVTATGTVCYWPGPPTKLCVDPDGDAAVDTSNPGFVLPGATGMALIGRVGNGPWVEVGSGTTLSGKGELVFAVNESTSQITQAASRSPCLTRNPACRARVGQAGAGGTTTTSTAGRQVKKRRLDSHPSPPRDPRTNMASPKRRGTRRSELSACHRSPDRRAGASVFRARDTARELPNLPLQDALQLVHLYIKRGSPKAEPAARRWLVRYLSEGSPSLRDVARSRPVLRWRRRGGGLNHPPPLARLGQDATSPQERGLLCRFRSGVH